jgi:MraZ protein
MLIGEYIHSVDEKNRISLPKKFRKEIGKFVVLAPGLDASIFMFTTKEWEKISSRLGEASMVQVDILRFNRFMFGGATQVEIDSQGRFLIPDFLKDRSFIKNKVAIIGVQNRVEIWDEKRWILYKKNIDKEADVLAQKLGSVGVL